MRELSLFTGAGGGVLATQHLLGWRTVGYVELDRYCQRVLRQRIRDGLLSDAPIFGDVRRFLRDGWARRYRGRVDCVSAGFPCQPFSAAGRRRAADDERNLWPETAAVIREVRPRFVVLENVPGLLSSQPNERVWLVGRPAQGALFDAKNRISDSRPLVRVLVQTGQRYVGTVLGDLAEMGFDARWGVLGASDAGAPHLRNRVWIVAAQSPLSDSKRDELRERRQRRRKQHEEPRAALAGNDGTPRTVADADGGRCEGVRESESRGVASSRRRQPDRRRALRQFADAPIWGRDPAEDPESGVGRVADGVAYRVDRLKAIGNGQVPAVAALAWDFLK